MRAHCRCPPLLPETVQLTELIFPVALWSFRQEMIELIRRYRWFSLALALYVAANLVSALVSQNGAALLEAGARAYLALLAFVVVAHVRSYGSRSVAVWWRRTTVGVATACVLVYGGVILGLLDPGGWVVFIPDYPIFGPVYRLRGTATVYGMMYMLLLPGLLIAYARWRAGWGLAAAAYPCRRWYDPGEGKPAVLCRRLTDRNQVPAT
ncbi:hypothetical protein [Neolewinella xylanilytica]|uniref:hypothetical protein n=1 Tax=Neolewinella xylanilytica TaxID=1514080 RepID=UPI000CEADEDA|nr:hypothetical protein [Neolewinella xylanilytica]